MGLFRLLTGSAKRPKPSKPLDFSFTYTSASAQAAAARKLCDQINRGERGKKCLENKKPGQVFATFDTNNFPHTLCIDENGRAVPEADAHGGGCGRGIGIEGGYTGGRVGAMGFQQQQQQRGGPEDYAAFHFARFQQQQQQQQQQPQQQPQQRQQGPQHHSHPTHAQPTQAPTKDSHHPLFKNPFLTDEKPQGSYGKREYVPDQEGIRVSHFGAKGDDPAVGWEMMRAREQLRKRNG